MINEISFDFSRSFGAYVQDAVDADAKEHQTTGGKDPTVGQETVMMETFVDAEADALITVCDQSAQLSLKCAGT